MVIAGMMTDVRLKRRRRPADVAVVRSRCCVATACISEGVG